MTAAAERSPGAWAGAVVFALVGAGLAIGSPTLVAAAAIPLAFLAATYLGTAPPETVRVRRRFAAGDGTAVTDGAGAVADEADGGRGPWFGSPGDVITVRTTLRNAGPDTLVDCRVVDGVPDPVPVVDGSPRTCVTLEPGAETTLEYDVRLPRGEFTFADPTVRLRDFTGTVVRTVSPAAAGDRELRCARAVDEVPLDSGRDDYAGQVPTDEGGRGVEFYAVREYERGDPVGAIDWRRYASSRDLATVEYRAERSTRVVCLVDARPSQYRDGSASRSRAVDLSLDAAERAVGTLVDAGHPTGLVGLHADRLTAVRPGTDTATRRRVRDLLAAIREADPDTGEDGDDPAPSAAVNAYPTPEALANRADDDADDDEPDAAPSYTQTEAADPTARLPAAMPGEALVYLFSSFVDDEPTEAVELLRSHGYAVRVVSPDVTGGEATADRLAALARRTRLADVRATGATVVDWALDRPLELALQTALGEAESR